MANNFRMNSANHGSEGWQKAWSSNLMIWSFLLKESTKRRLTQKVMLFWIQYNTTNKSNLY